jgi:hypothetical protein
MNRSLNSTKEYQCAVCKGVFQNGWTDEEARAEQEANGWKDADCDIVCDDCYDAIIADPAIAFREIPPK